MDYFFTEGDGIFEGDNARDHRARIVDNWFQEHEGSFTHLILPPQDPDFNPIAVLWDVLQRELGAETNLSLYIEDLGDKLLLLWSKIFIQTLHKLI
ncbi:hypothetical protein AVEN_154908-1 [Araneus ventricosus]|uniref:Tc1-like transposase DDE domain-containing protein n=1 Tax=Araneus ventricosus TaxID=182803 RepID=A0A4Y2A8C7_ARAVE|nr:hypothetical protein AVEN_154908-1 [Araneus ventricosus]